MSPVPATLREVVARLPELSRKDDEGEAIDHIVFAARVEGKWTAHSPARAVAVSVYADEDPVAPPGMDYFLEASIARDVIAVYKRRRSKLRLTPEEAVRAVIHDAYLPMDGV